MAEYKKKDDSVLCAELGVNPAKLKEMTDKVNQMFCLRVEQEGNQYYGQILERSDTLSGREWKPLVSLKINRFETPQEAADFLNEWKDQIILSANYAASEGIAQKALRLIDPIVLTPGLTQKGDRKKTPTNHGHGRV